MTNPNLSIARLIKVAVSLSVAAAQPQNLNTLLILGSSAVIDTTSRIRTYASIGAVATDFGTTAPEYLAAVLWFEQNGSLLLIGRWAQTASSGALYGAPLNVAQQAVSNFSGIASGGFTYTLNGTVTHVSGIVLTGVQNLNAVAAAITAQLAGATCVWNSVYSQFIITSSTTGATSSVSFLTAPTAGTDISALLGGTASTTSGAYLAPGIAAETALTAVTLFDSNFGQKFFGLAICGAADSDHEAIAPYIEAATNFHYYGVSTTEAGVIAGSSTTDIAYILTQGAYNRTGVQYSSTNPYAVVSLLAKQLTVNYTANNTVIDLFYKQEPGITAETLTESQMEAAEAKNCSVFVAYNNNTAIIDGGNSCSGNPISYVVGAMAFAVDLMTNLYNVLYGSLTKIPQTDAGMHMLATSIESTAVQYVSNGFLAPGYWTGPLFGTLVANQFLSKGFYLFTPSVAAQVSSSRAAGASVPFQLAAKFSGAVRNVNLAVTVNQ